MEIRNAKTDLMVEFIEQAAVQRGNFLLTSGRRADVYVNAKKVLASPLGLWHAATAIAGMIESRYDALPAIAGKAEGVNNLIGGVLSAFAIKSQFQKYASSITDYAKCPPGSLIFRPAKAEHGMMDEVITNLDLEQAAEFAILEDVTTTGGSVETMAAKLRARRHTVRHCFCVVDREEGAEEYLRGYGIELHAVLKLSDLVAAMKA